MAVNSTRKSGIEYFRITKERDYFNKSVMAKSTDSVNKIGTQNFHCSISFTLID